MGREIRRIPIGWEHPTTEDWRFVRGRGIQRVHEFRPMFDAPYMAAALEWDAGWAKWQRGEHEYQEEGETFESECGSRPHPDDYFPDWPADERTGWCVYETVSEGTPVTPVFATPEELIDYLVEHGDFWDQKRRAQGESLMPCAPWEREAATRFVTAGWAPSLILADGRIHTAGNMP